MLSVTSLPIHQTSDRIRLTLNVSNVEDHLLFWEIIFSKNVHANSDNVSILGHKFKNKARTNSVFWGMEGNNSGMMTWTL